MCRNFHIMNIDLPAGVGAPPLDIQLCMQLHTGRTILRSANHAATFDRSLVPRLLFTGAKNAVLGTRRI